MIYNDWGIILVAIAKNATTSIHQLLDEDMKFSCGQVHRTYKDISDIIHTQDYVTISCVRNPYDRLYSAWKHIFHIDSSTNVKSEFKKFVKGELNSYITSDIHNDGHWSTQSSYIVENDVVQVDWVFRFESLAEDWVEFTKWYNAQNITDNVLSDVLPMSNQTIKTEDPYDEETLDIVYNFYKEDFDMFGYNK